MPDIKKRPAMDKPKMANRDFVPKKAELLWKQHYISQEQKRGPKEQGSVQYAAEQVESYGRQSLHTTARAGQSAIRQIKSIPNRSKAAASDEPISDAAANHTFTASDRSNTPDSSRSFDSNSLQMPANTQQSRVNASGNRTDGQQVHSNANISTTVSDSLNMPNSASQPYNTTGLEMPSYGAPSPSISHRMQSSVQGAAGNAQSEQNVLHDQEIISNISPDNKPASPAIKKRQYYPKASIHRQNAIKSRKHQEKAASNTAAKASQRAKQAIQQRLQRKLAMQSKVQSAQKAGRLIQKAAAAAKAVLQAAKATISSLISTGGGVVVLIVLLLLILIAAIAASPFGILFSNESSSPDSVPISAAIAEINYDFNARLEELQQADAYDSITISGNTADWVDMLVIFAVKTAGSDDVNAMDVVTMDTDRIARLKAVFSDMNDLFGTVDTIQHPDSDPEDDIDDSWAEKRLHITISSKTVAEMIVEYGFTAQQIAVTSELLEQRVLLEALIGDLSVVSADAAEVIQKLPVDLNPVRQNIVKTACSLVGKVGYFWGGKSLTLGWDSRWGTMQKVWAEGNSTTGTYRPFGLDCSGFVDWVFYNVTDGAYVMGHGGGAASQHTYCTPISWSDALPGDLVFYPNDTHVGIVVGWDENGEILIAHCASGQNQVVITGKVGFATIGRPEVLL